MGEKTNVAYGDPVAVKLQAAGLFSQCMQRLTTMNRLVGKMPKQGDAEKHIRNQTSTSYPIVRVEDFGKGSGDEVEFDFINPVNAVPIMGSEKAEGRGTGVSLTNSRIRVNQARFPVDLGDVMTQVRTPVDIRRMGRPILQSLMDRYMDQSYLVHLAGARGMHKNVEWVVPLASDARFEKVMVNPVKCPTKNRHYISTGSGIEPFKVSAGEASIATSDVFNKDVVDSVRTLLESIALPPSPVIFDGDDAAYDSPTRVLLVSPAQFAAFSQDASFRTFQANAMARAQRAKMHPIFAGQNSVLWNGILVVQMPKPIRFYAGDSIAYAASYTSETESAAVVASGFGTGFAVDRAILLGGQALAHGLAKHPTSGAPFYFSEQPMDHGNSLEVLIAAIHGAGKVRFNVDHGDSKQFTDLGVTVIDTAVKLTEEA
jgi:N4-gp56 family major capsid protein